MPEPAVFLMTLTILVNLLDSANLVAIINAEVVTMVAITTPMEIEMAVEIGLAEDDTSSLLKPVHIIHPDLDLVSLIRVIQPTNNNGLDLHLGLHGTLGSFLPALAPHHHALILLNLGPVQDHLLIVDRHSRPTPSIHSAGPFCF